MQFRSGSAIWKPQKFESTPNHLSMNFGEQLDFEFKMLAKSAEESHLDLRFSEDLPRPRTAKLERSRSITWSNPYLIFINQVRGHLDWNTPLSESFRLHFSKRVWKNPT
jgi:hypothetical protein